MKKLFVVLPLLLITFAILANGPVAAERVNPPRHPARTVVYVTNFDGLAPGLTQPFPGTPGQDGWYQELAQAPGFGEIQNQVAVSGQALHEFTSSDVPGHFQTIDKRLITPPNLRRFPLITLQVDFYARTSALDAQNGYDAFMAVSGGPHPGYEIVGFGLTSGNGVPKGEAQVNIVLNSFNGQDNNVPVFPSVGQHLAWERWHRVILVVDQSRDRYVSLTVNGRTEDLSGYTLPRSELNGIWSRGQLMEAIIANIAPHGEFVDKSDDDIYWDNLRIVVESARR